LKKNNDEFVLSCDKKQKWVSGYCHYKTTEKALIIFIGNIKNTLKELEEKLSKYKEKIK